MSILTDYTAVIRMGSYSYQFADKLSNEHFSAVLEQESDRIRLKITPKYATAFDDIAIYAKADIKSTDMVFLNGYQSWTDSREYDTNDKMAGIDHIPKLIVKKYSFDKYGDYGFAKYSNRTGDYHGFSYGYIRRGDEYCLFGSVNEKQAFSLINVLCKDKEIRIVRESEGVVFEPKEYTALDIAVLSGSENEVFDRYFELSNIKCRDAKPLAGYTSWYRHYQDISEEKLLHDLDAVAQAGGADIFQIDDGYQKAVGDWLKTDGIKFPHGMKYMCDEIHEKGLKAGIWLAPFVAEKNSYIYRNKKEWLLRGEDGKPVPAGCNWSGSYVLDIYNTEVVHYLKKVFDKVLNEWGFDLVKLDFLYAACIVPRQNKSRGQIMSEAMALLRELVGEKLILACGVPLASAFGLADYCRIGCDVGLDWDDRMIMQLTHRERVSTKNSIYNTVFRRQLNGRAFLNDPDVFLLRDDNIKLTGIQKQALAIVNNLFGSVYFTSDDVSGYSEKQKKVLGFAHSMRGLKAESAGISDGVLTFTYTRNGKKITAALTADGGIHVVR